jgi:hypothetical protein
MLNDCVPKGQRDLEREFSADEREAYKGTPSEETEKEKQNVIQRRKSAIKSGFSTLIP